MSRLTRPFGIDFVAEMINKRSRCRCNDKTRLERRHLLLRHGRVVELLLGQRRALDLGAAVQRAPRHHPQHLVTSGKLQVASYKLQVTGDKVQVTGYELQVTSYKLQATSYRLQVTGYELQGTRYTLQSTSYRL